MGGLGGFIKNSGDPVWQPQRWAEWPHVSIAMDQGPDGLAACWLLLHKGANITIFCDPSHGAWADTKQLLKDNQLFSWWLLMMVGWNVPHGPWNDDQRFALLREGWEDMEAHHTARSSALFQHYAPDILEDIGGTSALDLDGDGSVDIAVWRHMLADPPTAKKGMKINLNRFFHGLEFARQDLHRWHARLLAYEYIALEQGMLASRRIDKVRVRAASHDADEESKCTTDSSLLNLAERGIRSAGQNALEVAVGVFGDRMNNILVRVLLTAVGPTEAWFRSQSHELRSGPSSLEWLGQQIAGGFMQQCCDTVAELTSRAALEFCRFQTKLQVVKQDDHEANGELLLQDELAGMFGRLATGMVALRVKRCLWMVRSWPVRICGITRDDCMRETLVAFRTDHMAWRALMALPNPSVTAKAYQCRSVFTKVAVQNLVQAQPGASTHDSKVWLAVFCFRLRLARRSEDFETKNRSPTFRVGMRMCCARQLFFVPSFFVREGVRSVKKYRTIFPGHCSLFFDSVFV